MIDDTNLFGLYIGLAIGLIYVLSFLLRHKKAPEFMQVVVVILSCTGAVLGVDLGYLSLTVDEASFGDFADQRVPIVLGALAVTWTAIETLIKTFKQNPSAA